MARKNDIYCHNFPGIGQKRKASLFSLTFIPYAPGIVAHKCAGVNFANVLRTAFMLVDPKSVKNTVKSSVSFYSFGICRRKSCK